MGGNKEVRNEGMNKESSKIYREWRSKDRLVVLTDHLEQASCPLCTVGWGVGDVKP